MKDIKLYNMIFPIWLMLLCPPVIFITIVGNFVIDSIVLIICFKIFKLKDAGFNQKKFYKETIIYIWLFGFVGDIIGALILISSTWVLGFSIGLFSEEFSYAIAYNPFSQLNAFIFVLFTMIVSGICIFILNYKHSFKNHNLDNKIKYKISLTIAIITIPFTFLLPTEQFFYIFQ